MLHSAGNLSVSTLTLRPVCLSCSPAWVLLLLLLLQPGDELPAGADKRVHIHFMPGSCMTMVPVAPAAAAAAAAAVTVAADGSTVEGGSEQQQQTQVCVVANIETETHVPEAIISFVLKVSPAAAAALPFACFEVCQPVCECHSRRPCRPCQAHPDAKCPAAAAAAIAVVQVFAPFFYSTVLKVLASAFKPSDPLPERMAAHHELYDMIMTRCADFLAGHPD
jgi:hypothetical protein